MSSRRPGRGRFGMRNDMRNVQRNGLRNVQRNGLRNATSSHLHIFTGRTLLVRTFLPSLGFTQRPARARPEGREGSGRGLNGDFSGGRK